MSLKISKIRCKSRRSMTPPSGTTIVPALLLTMAGEKRRQIVGPFGSRLVAARGSEAEPLILESISTHISSPNNRFRPF